MSETDQADGFVTVSLQGSGDTAGAGVAPRSEAWLKGLPFLPSLFSNRGLAPPLIPRSGIGG